MGDDELSFKAENGTLFGSVVYFQIRNERKVCFEGGMWWV